MCAIPSLPITGFTYNSASIGGVNNLNLNTTMRDLSGLDADDDNAYLGRSRSTYGLAVETWQRLSAITSATPTPTATPLPPAIVYPSGTLGTRLKTAATLLSANLGTRVITIHWGGFDTHTGQIASQDRQLIEFSRALARVPRRPRAAAGSSSASRRSSSPSSGAACKENGTGTEAGTDHGAGGLMFAMGSAVRGGFAADWPGCEVSERTPANENQGNLKVPTDYRSVYYSVIEEWFDERSAGRAGRPDDRAVGPR